MQISTFLGSALHEQWLHWHAESMESHVVAATGKNRPSQRCLVQYLHDLSLPITVMHYNLC